MHSATIKKLLFPLHIRVSSLSGKDIELANKAVKRPLSGDLEVSITLHTQERAQIGKHAADNEATKAATHFSKLLDSKIGEFNVSIVELSNKKLYLSSVALCTTI